jgi:two-component system OmpR family response regulator
MSVENRGLVLVAEDERPIADLIGMYLRRDGFGVHAVATGPDALAAARRLHPVAMILDVGLPGIDGTEVCRTLRAEGDSVPILFCTARDEEIDRVLGLEMGGDDYITKPFSLEEVVARIRAVLRRVGGGPHLVEDRRLRYAGVEMDVDSHEAWRDGVPLELSPTEFALLRFLLENAEIVVSKAQILQHVWGYDFGGDGNVVESYIRYLRRKVDVTQPPLIQTVRGVGYVLRVPRAAA